MGMINHITMSDLNECHSKRKEYNAPLSEFFSIASEYTIMTLSRDEDNEHTFEEDLF